MGVKPRDASGTPSETALGPTHLCLLCVGMSQGSRWAGSETVLWHASLQMRYRTRRPGLSYASFELHNLRATDGGGVVSVHGSLRNTAARAGTEVIQVYARGIGDIARRLVGFVKLEVPAGEEREVCVAIASDRLAAWDPAAGTWRLTTGPLTFEVVGTFGSHLLDVVVSPTT
jgi:hypothetical protein